MESANASVRSRADWLIPAGLILLGVLPLIGGAIRLTELATADATLQSARFFAEPVPVVLHILSSTVYFILGALQFSAGIRRGRPDWHRAAGRVLVPAGLVSALSGLWMAWSYPPLIGDGTATALVRTFAGSCVVVFIGLGFAAIRARDIPTHRAWMTRAYALAIAAGTHPLTLAPLVIFPQLWSDLGYATGLAAGWLINFAVAEWVIRRRVDAPRRRPMMAFH